MHNFAESYITIRNHTEPCRTIQTRAKLYRIIQKHQESCRTIHRTTQNHTESYRTYKHTLWQSFFFIYVGHIEHFGFNPVNMCELHSCQIQFNIIQLRLNLRRAIFMIHDKNSVRVSNLSSTWHIPRTSYDQTLTFYHIWMKSSPCVLILYIYFTKYFRQHNIQILSLPRHVST